MPVRSNIVGIDSPEALEKALRAAYYLADDGLATASYLSLALGKPLLLEGAPGVGKTEAAKAIADPAARPARGAAPPLRLPLDRLSARRARGAHRHDAGLQCR